MTSNEENKNELKSKGRGRCSRFGRGRWIAFPFIMAAMILVKSALVMLLWNALIPDLFHGPEIAYLQAIGLSVLAKLLIGFGGGFGGRGRFGHHKGFGGRFGGDHDFRGGPWGFMSAEDREKMREEFRKRREEFMKQND